jgi:hypothetical protein
MQKTLPERVEYEQLGRDPSTHGRLVQGGFQLRFECDNHHRISLDDAPLSKNTTARGRIATVRMLRMAEPAAKIAFKMDPKWSRQWEALRRTRLPALARRSPAPAEALSESSLTGHVEPEKSLEVLLRLAAGARFFRSAEGRLFAQVPVDSRHEIHGLKSTVFRDWLNRQAGPSHPRGLQTSCAALLLNSACTAYPSQSPEIIRGAALLLQNSRTAK